MRARQQGYEVRRRQARAHEGVRVVVVSFAKRPIAGCKVCVEKCDGSEMVGVTNGKGICEFGVHDVLAVEGVLPVFVDGLETGYESRRLNVRLSIGGIVQVVARLRRSVTARVQVYDLIGGAPLQGAKVTFTGGDGMVACVWGQDLNKAGMEGADRIDLGSDILCPGLASGKYEMRLEHPLYQDVRVNVTVPGRSAEWRVRIGMCRLPSGG